MTKESLYTPINSKDNELKEALTKTDISKIKELTLEAHAMVHLAEVSGKKEKTIADYILDYMLCDHQNDFLPREDCPIDLHYAGSETVPLCWQLWHTYRIEDLVSNILIADQKQIFNSEWKNKLGVSISDTGNALEYKELVQFGKAINVTYLREYMIEVGKNSRQILEKITLESIRAMVPEERVMRILEEGGVTTDFRSIWLLVFWGRLTIGEMILTPMTDHHMMHLAPCINNLPILE